MINVDLNLEAITLSQSILSKSQDPIEEELSRTSNRVTGALLGLLIMSFPGAIFLFDAKTDEEKLQKIKEIKEELGSLNKVERENPAIRLQEEVYSDVETYTSTARKIKNIIGMNSLIFSIGASFFTLKSFFPNPSILDRERELAVLAIKVGLLMTIPPAAYGLYHWLIEGSKLNARMKSAATKFLEPSSV